MIVAHLPAGYLLSSLLLRQLAPAWINPKAWLAAGMLGAIAPDIDMLWFHLVDHGQRHHHTYFTHFPLVWTGLLLASAIWLAFCRARQRASMHAGLAFIFSLNGFLHMALDTVVGDMWWLTPFVDKSFSFFSVPALYRPWWLNFIFHWSFVLELVIVVAAVLVWHYGKHIPEISRR